MVFTIPSFKELTDSTQKITNSYQTERSAMDAQRFFASIRPLTKNAERIAAGNFIQKITGYVVANKMDWGAIDKDFAGKDYASCIAPFLKEVIAGALLLELSVITKTYADENKVKTNSALGKIILDLFEIDKLSDVPTDKLRNCLSSLHQVLDVTNKQKGASVIQWHETVSNQDLMLHVSEVIDTCAASEVKNRVA